MTLLTYVPLKVPAWGEREMHATMAREPVGVRGASGSILWEWAFRLFEGEGTMHTGRLANDGKENNPRKNRANKNKSLSVRPE
jgi:hypothetical protein